MKNGRPFSQNLLWFSMTVVIGGMITIGILTNITLRSIEKNLPNTLLSELNDLSFVLEGLAVVVAAADQARTQPSTKHLNLLKTKVDAVYKEIIDLRESYVFDNMVKASAFHAVVAPAIADLQIWLSDGVSGYGPETKQTLTIAWIRIQEAYQKSRGLIRESRTSAQNILENQKSRLDRFLLNVNLLFVLAIIITFSMVYLLVRQYLLQRRESIAQTELRNQRDLLDSLFENVMLGVTVWNQEGELLLSNRGFADVTGYSMEEIKTLEDWFPKAYPDPEYREKVLADWKISTGQESVIREFKVTCKNGEVKDIEFRGTFLPDGRALVTMSDITDRKESERMIQESQEIKARSRKMESLGLLAGGVAHDLNNILSGIVSYPELLLLDLPEDSNLRKPIQTIQESGQRAAAIVLDLLTVARGVATTKEPTNLNDLIIDYLKSPEFEKLKQFHEGVKIETNLDNSVFNINGSQVHIRKVVMNLVSNAAEAIEKYGTITISTQNRYIDKPFRGFDDFHEGEYAVLSVSDDGSGISNADIERIFEPFYTKKMMGRSGTGLGLAVVWNVVQDHKGFIDLKSGKNNTTFDLYFPVTREAISDKNLHRPVEDYKGNGEVILIIDDVESQREIAIKMLEKLGYSAVSVSSGEDAIEYLKKHEVDLLILDMIMDPGINGRETYERILENNPNQKAIIASGFAETNDVKKAQQLGAGKYIRKPFTLENLGIVVKEELGK
jgi:PAS domain S-box-containing protein